MTHSIKIIFALGLIYLVWGSSYLAIRVAVQSVEPFLFCSIRFFIAAPLMFTLAFWHGEKLPSTGSQWVFITITAVIMQVISSGLMAWGQQWVPSGEAALIMSCSALWLAWLGSLGNRGDSVPLRNWLSIFAGIFGLVLLVGAGQKHSDVPFFGYAGILFAAFCWSGGSILVRRYNLSTQTFMTAALHISIAAILMAIISFLFEQPASSQWTPKAMMALFYLAIANSFIAYAAYYWLIHAARPALLGTFAYVTPAIAVALGAAWLDETLSRQQILGTMIILISVFLLMYFAQQPKIGKNTCLDKKTESTENF